VGALTSFLRAGYIPCGSPGDLISVTGRPPLTLLGALEHQMVLQVLFP
jgi:hypothetical protein